MYVKLNKKVQPEVLDERADDRRSGAPRRTRSSPTCRPSSSPTASSSSRWRTPSKRLERLHELMQAEIEILQVEKKIRSRVKKQMEKTQKEYYLNEQMQAIQKELGGGERDEFKNEIQEIEEQLKTKRMSKEAAAKVKKELKKLKMMHPTSAEATVVRNYIDWIITLPWYDKSEETYDLTKAEEILEEDHYGLKKIKERILEYLAVQALTKKLKGPVLCFVGPPGVGKTSLAKSIARATGRKFVRLSLGGVRDEAEIRGHRRTYIGAMPGKLIQSLKKVGDEQPRLPARRGRQDVDRLPRRPGGGAARGARPRAEPHLQRPLPRPRLRPLGRDVHHDGEHARRHPDPAPGPHGDHPALRLHRVREAQHRGEVPRPAPAQGVRARRRAVHAQRERDPHDHPPLHARKPASARSSARSPASAARSRGRWWPTAKRRRSRSSARTCPKYLGRAQVPRRQEGRARRDRAHQRPLGDVERRRRAPRVRGRGRRRQGQARHHRPAREGHGGERAGRDELRALARRGARARAGFLPKGRRARSLPRVRPEGRAERRRDDGDAASRARSSRCP